MKIGILAFGSLIDDPGEEIANVISGHSITVETPFPVEYGRFSLRRDFEFDCEICESKSYRITSQWDKNPRLGGELS